MFYVYGIYQNAGKPGNINTCEELLMECETRQEAERVANIHRDSWDKIEIREE